MKINISKDMQALHLVRLFNDVMVLSPVRNRQNEIIYLRRFIYIIRVKYQNTKQPGRSKYRTKNLKTSILSLLEKCNISFSNLYLCF